METWPLQVAQEVILWPGKATAWQIQKDTFPNMTRRTKAHRVEELQRFCGKVVASPKNSSGKPHMQQPQKLQQGHSGAP